MKKKNLVPGSPIFIRIFKHPPELELWVKKARTYVLYKRFTVCDMSGTIGPKLKEGDHQAPEGFYRVGVEQMNPWSRHHLSFNLGFPNQFDRCHERTGSALMVHGKCNSIGCFAMADFRMEEIYTLADAALANCQGSFQVHIFPFRMTKKNLLIHRGKWDSFWLNLKEGYDIFEKTHIPPTVMVKGCRYVFGQ
ncbi:L,D-transpeptidase family protein [Desulfomarina sp.]